MAVKPELTIDFKGVVAPLRLSRAQHTFPSRRDSRGRPMARAETLPDETDEERGGYLPVDETEIYVGDRVRVRELVKRTGLGRSGRLDRPMRVNGVWQTVRNRVVRTTIAEVHRVAAGKDGSVYITGVILESHCPGEEPLRNDRFRHKVGSVQIRDKQKSLYRHLNHGPCEEVRGQTTAVNHSHVERMRQWQELLAKVAASGIALHDLQTALSDRGDKFAKKAFERRVEERSARGTEPLDEPEDLGGAEYEATVKALKLEAEPEHWMWPVALAAATDPMAFNATWKVPEDL